MSAEVPISASLRDKHRDAVHEFCRWRGLCVDHYAQIESSMAKAVEAISAHNKGSKAKRPTMFGASLLAVKKAVGAAGPFASAGTDIHVALENADAALSERNKLIHATGRVLIDEDGAWVWLYRYQPTGANKSLEEGFITQNKAKSREKELRQSREDLKDKLKRFADLLAKTEVPNDAKSAEPVPLP